jgi:hypothetical protein
MFCGARGGIAGDSPDDFPGPDQSVIAMAGVYILVGREVRKDLDETRVECFGETTFLLMPVVSFEGRRPPNRPH